MTVGTYATFKVIGMLRGEGRRVRFEFESMNREKLYEEFWLDTKNQPEPAV